MRLQQRLKNLEQAANAPGAVDYVAILIAGRDAKRTGIPAPHTPIPPEWEHSRDPLKKRLFESRRRCGPG
jgi:hypothetical protein